MPGIQFFNSQECEWADVAVNFSGAPLTKLRGIRYKVSQDKEALYAAGDEPISIQSGNRKYEGEIKVLKGALDDMNRAAATAGGRDVLDLEFDVAITYLAKGARGLAVDTLLRCQITDYEKNMNQGDKQMEITLPIIFLGMQSV